MKAKKISCPHFSFKDKIYPFSMSAKRKISSGERMINFV
jgi:hypothetical protein